MGKIKRETTVVGDIAPSGHGGLGATNDLDPKQTKKRDKKRREMNKQGNQLGHPKEFEQLADSSINKNVIEGIVKNEMFDLIIEQGKPNQIMDLYDNVTKMLALSLQYARMFMIDGMKLGPDAVEFNYKRSKAELSRISKLIRDIDQILLKVYNKHKQEAAQEMQDKEAKENPVEQIPVEQKPIMRKQLEAKEYVEIPVIKESKKKLNEAWTKADDLAKAHQEKYTKRHEKETERFRKEVDASKNSFLRKYKVKTHWDLTGDGAKAYREEWLPKYDKMWEKHLANMRKADSDNGIVEAKKAKPKQIPDKNANKLGVRKGDKIFNRWGTARVTKLEPGNKVKIRWMTPVTAKGDTDIMSTDKLKDSGGGEFFQNRRVNSWAIKGEM